MMNMDKMSKFNKFYRIRNLHDLDRYTKAAYIKKEEETSKKAKIEDQKKEAQKQESESSQSFEIIDHSDYTSNTNSFSIIETPETENDSFSIVNYSDIDYEIDSQFSIEPESETDTSKKEELTLFQIIRTARPLDNGQYLLSDGKIIGHKQWRQMCSQKPEFKDYENIHNN